MGLDTVLHPVDFLVEDGATPSALGVPWGQLLIHGHGLPLGFTLVLAPVTGGGGGC